MTFGEHFALRQGHNNQSGRDAVENVRAKPIEKEVFAMWHWVRSSAMQAGAKSLSAIGAH